MLQIWCYTIYANEGTSISRPHIYKLFPCRKIVSFPLHTWHSIVRLCSSFDHYILPMYLQIRNMVEKVPSFKEGGAFWFTDLTTPDSMYIFPVLTALTFWITVEVGRIIINISISVIFFVKIWNMSNLLIFSSENLMTTLYTILCMFGEVKSIPIVYVLSHCCLIVDSVQSLPWIKKF